MTSRADVSAAWQRLGDPPPGKLTDARLQLQWAAQLISAFGEALVSPREDDGHSGMTWEPARRRWISEPADVEGGAKGIRLSLRPSDMTLGLCRAAGAGGDDAEMCLGGRTIGEALTWLRGSLRERGGEAVPPLELGARDIPDHPVARGSPIRVRPDAQLELARWYADACLLLTSVQEATPGASDVRCWPHDMDTATLVRFQPVDHAIGPPSIRIGMTTGDEHYAQPYLYLTPWPYPALAELSDLPSPVRWHTKGWLGTVLLGSDLVAAGDARSQARRATRYVSVSLAACRELLGGVTWVSG